VLEFETHIFGRKTKSGGNGLRKIKTAPRQINKNAVHFCCGAFYAHLHSLTQTATLTHTHTHTCKQVWASSLARTHTNNHRVAGTGSLLHFCSAYFRALLIIPRQSCKYLFKYLFMYCLRACFTCICMCLFGCTSLWFCVSCGLN